MKKPRNYCYLVLLFMLVAFAGDKNQELIGNWEERNLKNSELIEFPNTLQFNSDGTYSIFNKVYAPKSKNHIVEKGKYIINKDTIVLFNRSFYTANHSNGNDSTLKIIIINRKDSVLSVNWLEYSYELHKLNKAK
jgi:hypothetical protein